MALSLLAYFQHHFPQADADSLRLVNEASVRRSYARQEHVLREGQVCHFIAYIERGVLRTYQLIDGQEQTLYFAQEEGWITSYHSFLTGKPSDIYIECLEEVELVMMPKALLMDQYQTSLTANVIGRRITERIYLEEYERRKDLLTLSAPQMYEKLIQTQPELMQRVQLQHIASYLGIAKESLSRIRRRFSRS